MRIRNLGFLSLSIFAVFAVAGLAVAGGTTSSWEAALPVAADSREADPEAPAQLDFAVATYEVDIFGALAVGTLVQEFVHHGETELVASYQGRAPRGMRLESFSVEIDGETLDDAAAPPEKKAPARGRRSPKKERTPVGLSKSRTFDVAPGQRVTVRSEFQMDLRLVEGRFILQLPAIRTVNAAASSRDTETEAPGVPSSISIFVHYDAVLPQAESSTHEIIVDFEGDRTVVELADGDRIESRDFELQFSVGDEENATLSSYVGEETLGERPMVLVFAPAFRPREESVRPKQVLFLLDTSGSMKPNDKLPQARAALLACLEKLRSDDAVNIIEFDSDFTMLREEPVQWQELSFDEASSWLDGLPADGGTRLLPALTSTLEQPEDPDYHRMIVVLTDGMVKDEEAVLEVLTQKLGAGRLFVVGIGEDVKQDTIERLAEFGRGSAAFADDPASLEVALTELFGSVSAPMAWDLSVEFGGADATIVGSPRIPDLYAGRPVTIHARVRGELPSEVELIGKTMDGEQTFRAIVPTPGAGEVRRFPRAPRRSSDAAKDRAKSRKAPARR